MKIKGVYTFREKYIPPRCTKPRYRDMDGTITVTIKEVGEYLAPIAMITTTNEWRKAENSALPDSIELIPVQTPYRWHNKKLYIPFVDMHGNPLDISNVEYSIKVCGYPYDADKKERIKTVKRNAGRFLIIGGIIYVRKGEPRYCINAFGLGHNHGGTGFFVHNYYNGNIGRNNYFNALERDKAIAYGKAAALGRGDTESVERIGEQCNIEVFIPEAVKCNPQKEHGEGCLFINSLQSVVNNAGSAVEAGLGVMALGLAGLSNKQ